MITKMDVTKIQHFLKNHDHEKFNLTDIVRLAELMTETMLLLLENQDKRTFDGLSKISQQIADTKKDLADFQADEMHGGHIPEAGRELDAVVEATENATNRIMEAAETIMSGDPSDPAAYSEMVNNNIIDIFEACSFQDITGQRISKVVRTLNLIEEQIGYMVERMAQGSPAAKALKEEMVKAASEVVAEESKSEEPQDVIGDLLNGPQFEGEGVNQSDVDALFD